jgi:hypothetical protein
VAAVKKRALGGVGQVQYRYDGPSHKLKATCTIVKRRTDWWRTVLIERCRGCGDGDERAQTARDQDAWRIQWSTRALMAVAFTLLSIDREHGGKECGRAHGASLGLPLHGRCFDLFPDFMHRVHCGQRRVEGSGCCAWPHRPLAEHTNRKRVRDTHMYCAQAKSLQNPVCYVLR